MNNLIQANKFLRQGYKHAIEDLRRQREINQTNKFLLEVADELIKDLERVNRSQGEELIMWQMRNGN